MQIKLNCNAMFKPLSLKKLDILLFFFQLRSRLILKTGKTIVFVQTIHQIFVLQSLANTGKLNRIPLLFSSFSLKR